MKTAWAPPRLPLHRHARGANGARLRLEPQKHGRRTNPPNCQGVGRSRRHPQGLQRRRRRTASRISLADLIVLGGCTAVEAAAKKGVSTCRFRSSPGRMDASLEQTDLNPFEVLKPAADCFPQLHAAWRRRLHGRGTGRQASLLTLTAPEMTVLLAACARSAPTPDTPRWCVSPAPGNTEQRLLRQPARHVSHRMAAFGQ